jgi:MazG family protein
MQKLRKIVARLRKECPWDRKQTVFSMRKNVIEEAYELSEAIRERNYTKIKEEIGDHLFIALFLTQIMEDTGKAKFSEITNGISRKLIGRHPHIFGGTKVRNAEDVIRNWNKIKEKEKGHSILEGVPRDLPALQRAESIQFRAKRVGFDWQDAKDVLNKVIEEVEELRHELGHQHKDTKTLPGGQDERQEAGNGVQHKGTKALSDGEGEGRRAKGEGRLRHRAAKPNRRKVREEFGDLLFALVNTARHMGIDAEDTLQRATTKFTRRFQRLEREFARRGKRLEDCSLEEMDEVWESHKKQERRRRKKT